jgi:hypothetical protein
MAANDGDHPIRETFPGISIPATTGAPGSSGVSDSPAGTGGGAVIASPVVSAPYGSSQLPENKPTLPVTQGDTSGFSDDSPVHESAIVPGPVADYLSTGAGQGSGAHYPRRPGQQPNGGAS